MAYTPRTPEDQNRLAAAIAANPALAAQMYPGGSEQQQPLPPPPGRRLATEADAASLGVTVDDIRRMMSNPSRYGPMYAKDGISPQAKVQPAVDNAKRTRTVKKADGTEKNTKTPERSVPLKPQQAPSTMDQAKGGGLDNMWPWLLGALGAGGVAEGARRLWGRNKGGGAPVDTGIRQLTGPVEPLVEANWTDARDIGYRSRSGGLPPPPLQLTGPPVPVVPEAPIASGAPIVAPDNTDEMQLYRGVQGEMVNALNAEPTTSDIIRQAQQEVARTSKGKGKGVKGRGPKGLKFTGKGVK